MKPIRSLRVQRKLLSLTQKKVNKIIQIGQETTLLPKRWDFKMGWRFLSYFDAGKWISFTVEPMYQRPCIVQIPSKELWAIQAPEWALNRRGEILKKLKNIKWNRDLEWIESSQNNFSTVTKGLLHPGSFESSIYGRTLESQVIFHPNSRVSLADEKAKHLYYKALREHIQSLKGDVSINPDKSSNGSVLKEIEWPAYQNNKQVNLYRN